LIRRHKLATFISSSDQTCFVKVEKSINLFVRVCHGRFHDILPKEYSLVQMILLNKEMLTNNKGLPVIVTERTNTEMK
jgi:hypothetical protein